MLGLKRQNIICPYCLTEIRTWRRMDTCPKCKNDSEPKSDGNDPPKGEDGDHPKAKRISLPVQYVTDYDKHPPFFVQVFGWPGVGKTVFLSAMTLMLVRMSKVWKNYSYAALTDASQREVKKIHRIKDGFASGYMPASTQPGQEKDIDKLYMMLLNDMELWGGRTLVMRDCAGEIFDTVEVSKEEAPFLLNAPTTFMLISLSDLRKNEVGHTMDMLMTNYINTLMKYGVDFCRERRSLVVVLTKADEIENLPSNLRNYLIDDRLWADINSPEYVDPVTALHMQEYLETMGRVSEAIRRWIEAQPFGPNFLNLAKAKKLQMRFSLISSTGGPVDPNLPVTLSPRRVLDPFFWALDFQSRE